MWFIKVLIYSIALVMCVDEAAATKQHARVIKHLLSDSDYDTSVRPVIEANTTTHVSVAINLHQIRDMLEKQQVLTTLLWFAFRWRDEFLTWNRSEYDGVDSIHIQASRIWTPDVILHNSVDNSRTATKLYADTNAVVNSDGSVFWITSALVMSSCKVDMALYPFDNQSCMFYFSSWTYDMDHINLTCYNDRVNMQNFVKNGEWNLMNSTCHRLEKPYPCCERPYADVYFVINLQRRPMFYLYNLLFPAICLLIVGTLAFWIPADSGEKVSLSVTTLLAMTVFMLIIMENIPATSEVISWLEKFMGLATGMLSLSTIMAVAVVNVHHHGSLGVPPGPWINKYVLGIGQKMLFMKSCYNDTKARPPKGTNYPHRIRTYEEVPTKEAPESGAMPNLKSNGQITGHDEMMRRDDDDSLMIRDEWREVAQVLNRICLTFYLLLMLGAVIYIMCSL